MERLSPFPALARAIHQLNLSLQSLIPIVDAYAADLMLEEGELGPRRKTEASIEDQRLHATELSKALGALTTCFHDRYVAPASRIDEELETIYVKEIQ